MQSLQLAGAAALLCAAAGVVFATGNAVGARDAKLFAKDDERRVAMIARACGKSGRLMYDHHTGQYECLWRNPDGTSVTEVVPPFPYLDQVANL